MSIYRVTTFFSGKGEGWSESFCFSRSLEDPGAVAAEMQLLAQKRAEMLGVPYQIDGYRVAKIRDAVDAPLKRVVFLNEAVYTPTDQSPGNDGDFDQICLIVAGTNGPGTLSSAHFVGGPPDSACSHAGNYDPNGNSIGTKFLSWSGEMLNKTAGWMNLPPTADTVVTGYVQNVNMTVTLTISDALFAGPFPSVVPIKVRCRQINGKSQLNRQLLVKALTATTCTTIEQIAVQPFVKSGNMKVYAIKSSFVPFAGMKVRKIGDHKRGKPSLVSPGRAKVQIRI